MIYKEDQHIVCEACSRESEYPVQDYVVPGKVGVASISDETCGYCDWEFTVERLSNGTYDVEAS